MPCLTCLPHAVSHHCPGVTSVIPHPPGCRSNLGCSAGQSGTAMGLTGWLATREASRLHDRPLLAPYSPLERKTGHFLGRSLTRRRNPLLQRYDAPQPSCRRHPNSACGRPNAPQWHPAEAIFHCYCHRGKIINPESANQTTTFSAAALHTLIRFPLDPWVRG